jgi:hypothetical protein
LGDFRTCGPALHLAPVALCSELDAKPRKS